MATDRLPMRHIREILRLKWGLKRSHRETARSLGPTPYYPTHSIVTYYLKQLQAK